MRSLIFDTAEVYGIALHYLLSKYALIRANDEPDFPKVIVLERVLGL